jgi:hypothetical protein
VEIFIKICAWGAELFHADSRMGKPKKKRYSYFSHFSDGALKTIFGAVWNC